MSRCRMNSLAGLRPLAVLDPLVGIAASLTWALPARGVEVPFTERVISTTAVGARSVFATDLDGDGDTDVLSASLGDDKIAWYESDGGSPPTFTERAITENPDGPGRLEGFAAVALGQWPPAVTNPGALNTCADSDSNVGWVIRPDAYGNRIPMSGLRTRPTRLSRNSRMNPILERLVDISEQTKERR